jgi:hypothetical protein
MEHKLWQYMSQKNTDCKLSLDAKANKRILLMGLIFIDRE